MARLALHHAGGPPPRSARPGRHRDDPFDRLGVTRAVGVADLPLGFGPDVMQLPCRPGCRHPLDHRRRQPIDSTVVEDRRPDDGGTRLRRPSHRPPGTPPRISTAWVRQVWRCSPKDRGSCLAARVSRVACCDKASDSARVGSRPCSFWKAFANSPTALRSRRDARKTAHSTQRDTGDLTNAALAVATIGAHESAAELPIAPSIAVL